MANSPPTANQAVNTSLYELASTVLGEDLGEYMKTAKANGVTWDNLYVDLRNKNIPITRATMLRWAKKVS